MEASGIVQRIGATAVLDGVSLALHASEVVALPGPHGAGTTTLVRLLLGPARPDAGTIRFRGRPLADEPAARSRIVGLLQRSPLFGGTVAENVAYGLRVRREPRADRGRRVREALARLGIEHLAGRDVRGLSGGEAQRVAIARATVLNPDLLILDEPASDLDVATRRRLLADLEAAVRRGRMATLIVTHDPREAFAMADRVYVLERGRVSQEGSPTDIVADPASPFIAELTGAELVVDGRLAGAREGLVEVTMAGGVRWLAVPADDPATWPAGSRLHVAYRPEDVVLAAAGAAPVSTPRNRSDATVDGLAPLGGFVRVRLAGPIPLVALVTREGAEALDLRRGSRVSARLKAVAARAYLAAAAD
jgi:ABC-type sulfate/molybdate transport systems ATPase subunit